MRLFLSVPLPEPVLEASCAMQSRLKKAVPAGIKWTAPEQMHITLHFIGEAAESTVPALEGVLRRAVQVPAFELSLRGAGAFPSIERPRVVWAGLDDAAGGLPRLHALLGVALGEAGFAVDARAFAAHVTLGRVKDGVPSGAAEALALEAPFRSAAGLAQSVELMHSALSPSGPQYRVLSVERLGGGI